MLLITQNKIFPNLSMKKEMATHSSTLAWETPWTENPVGLQSMGSQKSETMTNSNNPFY